MHVDPAPAPVGNLDPGAGSGRSHQLLVLLWIAFFLNQSDRQLFSVTIPLLQNDLGLTSAQVGLVATAFTITFGLCVPIAGLFGDVFRRGHVVLASVLIFSAGTLATAAASSILLLTLFRSLATGAGEAFYYPAAASLIGDRYTRHRARALAIHQTANYTGIVLGSLLAGLIADHFGWRAAFAGFGALGLVWAALLWRQVRAMPRTAPPGVRMNLRDLGVAGLLIVRSPAILAQTVAFGGMVFALVGYLTWAPTLLYERFDLSLADAGLSSVLYHHLAAYAGVLIVSQLSDRIAARVRDGRLYLMTASLALCAPFLWLTGAATSLPVIYAALACFGFFRGAFDANQFAALFDHVPAATRSTVTGLVVACGFLIGAISPLMMGVMKRSYGLEAGFQLLAAATLAAAVVLLLVTLLSHPRGVPA